MDGRVGVSKGVQRCVLSVSIASCTTPRLRSQAVRGCFRWGGVYGHCGGPDCGSRSDTKVQNGLLDHLYHRRGAHYGVHLVRSVLAAHTSTGNRVGEKARS